MEVLHHVILAVIVAIAAVIHPDPYDAIVFVEFSASTVLFRHQYGLLEELLVARLRIQAIHTHPVVAEPDESMTVYIDTEDAHAVGLPQQLGRLSISEGIDAAFFGGGIDVVAVGVQTRDMLVGQDRLLLECLVITIQAMDAMIRAQPDIALVAFGHACDAEFSCRHLLALQPPTVKGHHVEVIVCDTDQHLARTGDEQRRVGTEFLVSAIAFEGIDDLVGMTIQYKHAVVVHVHPDILRLVDDNIEDTVMQVLDITGVACLVVIEFIAVEARQAVPGGEPDKAEVVLADHRHGIAAQAVFGRQVRTGGLQLLGCCGLAHECHQHAQ